MYRYWSLRLLAALNALAIAGYLGGALHPVQIAVLLVVTTALMGTHRTTIDCSITTESFANATNVPECRRAQDIRRPAVGMIEAGKSAC